MNHKPYHAFFKKRLQTQSFIDTQMDSTNMSQLTSKIIRSLKNANIQSSKNREKVQLAKSRLRTKQNQQIQERQRLKQKLDSKMRLSQTNLQKNLSQKKKVLSSRSQFEQTQRKKFHERQKKQLQKSLVEMRKKQKQTQKFFRDTQQKKKQQFQRQQKLSRVQRTRYGSMNETKYKNTLYYDTETSLKNSRTNSSFVQKPPIKVLKVREADIQNKQKKKQELQLNKQCRYLSQYVAKMENIINVRKKGTKVAKQQTATLPKVVSRERSSSSKRRSISPQVHSNLNHNKQPSKKVSFSELYMQKLSQKRNRKQQFHSIILYEGDQILEKEHQKSKLLKQSKIIKQSLNQYRRWSNLLNNFKNGI